MPKGSYKPSAPVDLKHPVSTLAPHLPAGVQVASIAEAIPLIPAIGGAIAAAGAISALPHVKPVPLNTDGADGADGQQTNGAQNTSGDKPASDGSTTQKPADVVAPDGKLGSFEFRVGKHDCHTRKAGIQRFLSAMRDDRLDDTPLSFPSCSRGSQGKLASGMTSSLTHSKLERAVNLLVFW